jgi:acyl-CoA synthetase (AMP-forming)/AMP-acid ligase II
MLEILEAHARRTPDRAAVRQYVAGSWQTTTWVELHTAATAVATRAAYLTLRPGPVVLVLDNSIASAAVFVGLLAASVDVLCVESERSVPDEVMASEPPVVAPSGTQGASPGLAYKDLTQVLEASVPALRGGRQVTPVGGTLLQLTSGSTGASRVVRHPAVGIMRGAGIYRDVYAVTEQDKVLLPVPFAHSFGMVGGLVCALLSGAELLVLPSFNLRALHSGLADGASILLGTPLLYQLLSASAPQGLPAPHLRVALSSGGPMRTSVATHAERSLGLPVLQAYGSTETGVIACQRPGGTVLPGSVGPAAPGVDWRIESGDGAMGGRLLVRTSTLLIGYHGPPGTEPDADGFYDTGDLARTDETRQLYLTARKDTFINVGGRKVNPQRVEDRAEQHPLVREAKAFGRTWRDEQEVHLALALEAGAAGDTSEITSFLRAGLNLHEVPRRLYFLKRLPRTSLGKVNLPVLLEHITTETASDHGR